jgi:PEGA domain
MSEKERPMLTQLVRHKHKWIGVLAVLVSYFTVSPMASPLVAQTAVLGELTFKGASKVEKTSGVWIDGKYVGYLGELWGPKRILLIPGDHDLVVRQAGYQDFAEKLTVEPKELLLVPVKMQKATNDTWPTVTAELKVDVHPDRAAVFVDDRFLGHAGELGGAFHSMLISPGTHRIKVELPGYQSFETDVTLVAGQKSVVKTNLAKGSIHQADALIDRSNDSGHNK